MESAGTHPVERISDGLKPTSLPGIGRFAYQVAALIRQSYQGMNVYGRSQDHRFAAAGARRFS
jgi:hypothetical protein